MQTSLPELISIDSQGHRKKVKFEAKCTKNSTCTLACNNPNCKQNAFVCGSKLCECRTPHKKCLLIDIEQILDVIQEKRNESTVIIDKTCQVLDKWIDEISRTREKVQEILLDWGLSGTEKKFIEMINSQKYSQLTGAHINEITKQTVEYFTQQTKELMLNQIQGMSKNYDSQISSILGTFTSIFQRYQLAEKDLVFSSQKEIIPQKEAHFLTDIADYLRDQIGRTDGKYTSEDFNKFVAFLKRELKRDFEIPMRKFQKERRVYGSKKLREKYSTDYFTVLARGKEYMEKWQSQITVNLKHLSKERQRELSSLSKFYHQSQFRVETPFTAQMALSIQKAINTIYELIEFIKKHGKEMIDPLIKEGYRLNEDFLLIIYFLDGLMDTRPEIDQVQILWTVVRFDEKVKQEVNLLIDTINQCKKECYEVQIEA